LRYRHNQAHNSADKVRVLRGFYLKSQSNKYRIIALLSALLPTSVALAVDPPTPGTVGDVFDKPILKAPATDAVPPIKTTPEAKRAKVKSDKKIKVRGFTITGNVAFTSEELLAPLDSLVGEQLTLEEIYAAADILTSFYRERGFSLARVVVPSQKVNFGIIALEAVEGTLGEVVVEGKEEYNSQFMIEHIKSIKPGEPVSLDVLERDLLILNDLPGLTARAVVRPGKTFGTSDLLLKTEVKPFQGRVAVNNFGRQELGEWKLDGEFTFNNFTGNGDQFGINVSHSESDLLNFIGLAYNFPINAEGTRIGINATYVDYTVGGEFGALGIEGDTTDLQLTLTHPLMRSKRENLLLGFGLGENAAESADLANPATENDITLLEANLLYNVVHNDNSVSTLYGVLSTNFRSNSDGLQNNAQKAKLVVDASHLRSLDRNWQMFLRGQLTLSADPLVDSEKFSAGGQGSVRGFTSSEIRGDEGYQLTAELRRTVNLAEGINSSVRGFLDTAQVSRIEPLAGEDDEESITSLGLGVTVVPEKNISIDLEYARPVDGRNTSDGRDGGRFWANIAYRF